MFCGEPVMMEVFCNSNIKTPALAEPEVVGPPVDVATDEPLTNKAQLPAPSEVTMTSYA